MLVPYRPGEQHLIENFELAKADNFKGWVIHHRLELTLDGEFAHDVKDLERLGMYWNRPYYELIYMKLSEHSTLHNICKNPFYGRRHSDTTKAKISAIHKGKKRSAESIAKQKETIKRK